MHNFQISFMSLEDLDNISSKLNTEFDSFWNYNIIKSEINNPDSIVLVAKEDNQIIGFAGIWKAIDIMHLMDIVVAKAYRRKKIASLLLEQLINLSIEHNINELTLEVSQNNLPAINLYNKFGFKELGIRKNYYGVNNNAIIMTLYIDKNKEEHLSEKNK